MTAPTVRGSWSIAKAVFARWQSRALDSRFRAGWGALTASTAFATINDTMAQPAKGTAKRHPVPYCIYEQFDPVLQFRSSGLTADTVKECFDVVFQLTIYGGTKASAIAYAKIVAEAYDRAQLSIQDDSLVDIFRDGDFGTKHADETWSWSLTYRVRIDITYAGSLS